MTNPEPVADDRAREVRELWAIRWPDGSMSGAMFGDAAEHTVRVAGAGEEIVHCVETITRTAWEAAPDPDPTVSPEDHTWPATTPTNTATPADSSSPSAQPATAPSSTKTHTRRG